MAITLKHNFPFIARKKANHILVHLVTEKSLKALAKTLGAAQKAQIKAAAFSGLPESTLALRNEEGAVSDILCGVHSPLHYYDTAFAYAAAVSATGQAALPQTSFAFAEKPDYACWERCLF